jgi:hypothetical protein
VASFFKCDYKNLSDGTNVTQVIDFEKIAVVEVRRDPAGTRWWAEIRLANSGEPRGTTVDHDANRFLDEYLAYLAGRGSG